MEEKDYGMELVVDLHDCDPSTFTREAIELYFVGLCELIDMERCELHFWDDKDVPEAQRQTDPKTKGTSAVQFILTSSIVIHTLDLLKAAYLNIFSCRPFDADAAATFLRARLGPRRGTREFFAGTRRGDGDEACNTQNALFGSQELVEGVNLSAHCGTRAERRREMWFR